MAQRRRFTDQFKAKITVRHLVHPNQVSTWRRQAIENDVLSAGLKR